MAFTLPVGTATAEGPAVLGDCAVSNPMAGATPIGSSDGYTVFASGDAVLANSELEGSLAVGGVVTFGDPAGRNDGEYPLVHRIAGNGDYNVPTVEGSPNRLLIQTYDPAGRLIGRVKAQGATGENAAAGVRLADQSQPDDYLVRAGWGEMPTAFAPADGTNMSPQVASDVQANTDEGRASWNLTGTVLDQFPADQGAQLLSSYTDWQAVAPPAGNDSTITLNPAGPSTLPLSAFAGTEKFSLTGYSASSFLVIKVSPSDVVDGKLVLPSYSAAGNQAPANAGIQYLLFDLSEISGDVAVTTLNEPLRGALYAPNAHVIFPADGKEFEGQVIARDFTALQSGKEIHTNLFAGSFPCTTPPAETGTFTMSKVLGGVSPTDFPEGTTFPVTATWGEGDDESHTYDLPADGTAVTGAELPVGTTVTFKESALPPAPEGYQLVGSTLEPDTITIGSGDEPVAWTITNTYTPIAPAPGHGTFTMSKVLEGVSPTDFPDGTTFPVTATWGDGGDESRTYELPADGSAVSSALSLPVGTVVTFTEGDLPAAPAGYTFVSYGMSAQSITISGNDEPVAWTITNAYTRTDPPVLGGGFDLAKDLDGLAPDRFPSGTSFTVTASWDVEGERVTQAYEVPADGTVVEGARNLPAGTVVTFSETRPTDPYGFSLVSVTYSAEELTIESGETPTVVVTNTYASTGGLPSTGAASPGALVGWGALALIAGTVTAILWRRRAARASMR